ALRRSARYTGARPGHAGAHPSRIVRGGNGDAPRLRSGGRRPAVPRSPTAGYRPRDGWADEPPRDPPRATQPLHRRVEPLAPPRSTGGGGRAADRLPRRGRLRPSAALTPRLAASTGGSPPRTHAGGLDPSGDRVRPTASACSRW